MTDKLRAAFDLWLKESFAGHSFSEKVQATLFEGWIKAEGIGRENGKEEERQRMAIKPSRFKRKA
jgi:hypothetical protein